jgi:hypothetical protein
MITVAEIVPWKLKNDWSMSRGTIGWHAATLRSLSYALIEHCPSTFGCTATRIVNNALPNPFLFLSFFVIVYSEILS